MREILFRGKDVDNGEWVYGYLIKVNDRSSFGGKEFSCSYINQQCDDLNIITLLQGSLLSVNAKLIQVLDETLGQYSGLKDKQGVKIFEGDIVRHCRIGHFISEIRFTGGCFDAHDDYKVNTENLDDINIDCHIIGNIHEK